MTELVFQIRLKRIRRKFREFYGELAIEELCENKELIYAIEKLETQFQGLIKND